MVEGDRGIEADVVALSEHLETASVTAGEPLEPFTVQLGERVDHRDHVEENGPLGGLREQLQERDVLLARFFVATEVAQLRDLDRTGRAVGEHLGQREHIAIDHQIRRHRLTVEIALRGVRPEPLY